MKPHLIMPMGGAGSRFYKNGYMIPKPLIEINGKPFFYWATKSITQFIEVADITYVILQQHIDNYGIDKVIKKYFSNALLKVLPEILPGPVFTSIKGVEDIFDNATIIFNDCDHMFKCDALNCFLSSEINLEAALVTFKSHEPHFSYVKYDDKGNIIGTIEKQIVSNHAICGAYIFKNADLFKNIAAEYIENCPYDECFMSGLYNIICRKNMAIKDFLLDFHVEFGTPEEYEASKDSVYFNIFK